MDTKVVFEKTGKIYNEIKRLHQRIKELNIECWQIMEECPHEIVFKYKDNHPRKMPIDGYYFCPACGKVVCCKINHTISQSVFKSFKIIPLTRISLLGTKELFKSIRREVYNNFDYYYSNDVDIEELSCKMIEHVQGRETDFEVKKVLKKDI